ncbi:dephospho-CoA kinase [Candidatus Saccharibacteria bacterium]|nr:MAG: dephospho-CoA kinase [Candidatus Saccharibacteria bacterium]PID98938.1 MAG: dephospho-CoA kinase [Candidatus Saccharibacteria bacterium]
MSTKIITLVGMPGAGKGLCVEYLEKKGWPSVYFGGVTLDEVKRRGLAVNEANEKTVREELRATGGMDVIAKHILAKIDALIAQGETVVIADGLYSWAEYKLFKKRFGDDAIMVAVVSARQVRHERLQRRPVRPLTDEEATAREYAEIENSDKGGPIANADYTVLNDGSPETTYAQLDTILAKEHIS